MIKKKPIPTLETIKERIVQDIVFNYSPIVLKRIGVGHMLPNQVRLLLNEEVGRRWRLYYRRYLDIKDFHTIEREDNTLIGLA